MVTWLAANAATIIISMIILALTGLAVRSVYKNRGTCSCQSKSGCGGQCSCCHGCAPVHKPHS
ncbi:FeoB-associated Cys-rich membrane protein [Hungatella hathewayi]|uniref:FeoB-associated Cys-rich membrane protein n=1 Tax=Hungatella hathewayi TaxID=154046 RepID=UPI002A837BED|nr:FeoB-associated Cys-rich membrane protein [Hungatella hathewayi]